MICMCCQRPSYCYISVVRNYISENHTNGKVSWGDYHIYTSLIQFIEEFMQLWEFLEQSLMWSRYSSLEEVKNCTGPFWLELKIFCLFVC